MYSGTTPEGNLILVAGRKIRNIEAYVQSNGGYFVTGEAVSMEGLYQIIKKKMTVAERGRTWGK